MIRTSLFLLHRNGIIRNRVFQKCIFAKCRKRFLSPSNKCLCSSSATSNSTSASACSERQTVEMWGFETNQFGTLRMVVPFHVVIESLDPQSFPDMNRAFVKLLADDDTEPDSIQISRAAVYHLDVSLSNDSSSVRVSGKLMKGLENSLPFTCVVQVPLKFDLDIQVTDKADVKVTGMESEKVCISLQQGECILKSTKGTDVNIYSKGGNITSKSFLQGNIQLKTGGQGTIEADRLQGQTVHCHTHNGRVNVQTVYSVYNEFFSSGKTDVFIGSCHGNTHIHVQGGDIRVKSLDGDLDCWSGRGNIDMGLTRTSRASLDSACGDICVNLTETIDATIGLTGKEVRLAPQFAELLQKQMRTEHTVSLKGVLGVGTNSIVAVAENGKVEVKQQGWFTSLGLGVMPKQ